MVNDLFNELANLDEVLAIALGGSRAGKNYDEKSDYDVYLYVSKIPDNRVRKDILEKYCSYMEIGNHFWEYEDNCKLKNGIDIDILYRNIENITADIASVVENCIPHNGYTTCIWDNVIKSKIIYDKNGVLARLKERFSVPYPDKLKENIIRNNMALLANKMPAYDKQILKAAKRGDINSVNHRTAAFMESYFDIIFAMNKLTHPGEKRLISLSLQQCRILPANFESNIEKLFGDLYKNPEAIEDDLSNIITELKKVLANC